jgi:hypothetical protein
MFLRPACYRLLSLARSLGFSLFCAALLCSLSLCFQGHTVLRVDADRITPAQKHALQALKGKFKLDQWSATDFNVGPDQLAEVKQYLHDAALHHSVMIPDLQKEIDREDAHHVAHKKKCGEDVLSAPNGPMDFFSDYQALKDINVFCGNLATTYPELVTQKQIGTSYGGYVSRTHNGAHGWHRWLV